jgi:hypothetical protein
VPDHARCRSRNQWRFFLNARPHETDGLAPKTAFEHIVVLICREIIGSGITIKDRLRVLQPNDPDSNYENRELVPNDLIEDIKRAEIESAFEEKVASEFEKMTDSTLSTLTAS